MRIVRETYTRSLDMGTGDVARSLQPPFTPDAAEFWGPGSLHWDSRVSPAGFLWLLMSIEWGSLPFSRTYDQTVIMRKILTKSILKGKEKNFFSFFCCSGFCHTLTWKIIVLKVIKEQHKKQSISIFLFIDWARYLYGH